MCLPTRNYDGNLVLIGLTTQSRVKAIFNLVYNLINLNMVIKLQDSYLVHFRGLNYTNIAKEELEGMEKRPRLTL